MSGHLTVRVVRSVRTFLEMDAGTRRLIARALLYLAVVRLALWFMPFRVVRRLADRLGQDDRAPADAVSSMRLAWSIVTVSRFVPRATCLTQAMAGQIVLARHGYQSTLRIGVAKNQNGQVEAHAWVECDDRVVIGGDGHEAFQPLPDVFDRLR